MQLWKILATTLPYAHFESPQYSCTSNISSLHDDHRCLLHQSPFGMQHLKCQRLVTIALIQLESRAASLLPQQTNISKNICIKFANLTNAISCSHKCHQSIVQFLLEVHNILRNFEGSEETSTVKIEEFQGNPDSHARSRRSPISEVSTVTPG